MKIDFYCVLGLILSLSSLTSVCGEATSLREALRKVGEKHDCFFTVEEILTEAEGAPTLTDGTIDATAALASESLEAAVAALTAALPKARVTVAAGEPKVVRIVDKNLAELQDLVLDQRITDFSFTGTPEVLLRAINNMDFTLSSPEVLVKDGVDDTTPLKIEKKSATLRDLLTDVLPKAIYSRVLWVAWVKQKSKHTFILFGGQRALAKAKE